MHTSTLLNTTAFLLLLILVLRSPTSLGYCWSVGLPLHPGPALASPPSLHITRIVKVHVLYRFAVWLIWRVKRTLIRSPLPCCCLVDVGASLGLGLEVGRHVRPRREGRLCGRLPIWSLNLQAVRQLRSHPAAKRRRLRAAEFAWNRITHEHV